MLNPILIMAPPLPSRASGPAAASQPLPILLPGLAGDSYAAAAAPGQEWEPPLSWPENVLLHLPFITLPSPPPLAPSTSWGDRILGTGSQVFRWLQGSTGSLYQQAVGFFTGQPAAPPSWLNPAHFPTITPLRQQVVAIAHRYLGVPYVWGGETPRGFDCSGMVQNVYRQIGIRLPRNSAVQARVGIPVFSRSDLQPGDAVFLKGTHGPDHNAVTHVGLYIGNDLVLEATSPVARISPFNEGKWASPKYAGARRYIA